MAIDTYAPCPGGTGKKIKFCCADLVGDLEQLDKLVEGDQISAALDQVKRLEDKSRPVGGHRCNRRPHAGGGRRFRPCSRQGS